MTMKGWRTLGVVILSAAAVAVLPAQERPSGQGFSFRTGVALINVSVTVTDEHGRFVPNLKAEDFVVYEDGQPQPIQQFDSDRVPVSLGIALDTSGSMLGEKIAAAQAALNRFLFDLLGKQDEIFLYRFDGRPELVQGWTEDRQAVARALGSVRPTGGTAIYDTVAEAVPMAQAGTKRKKALLVISDGNDTSSRTRPDALVQLIRQSEVLVYAIGIDASDSNGSAPSSSAPAPRSAPPKAAPVPSPFPGKAPPAASTPPPAPVPSAPSTRKNTPAASDRVNVEALRRITDDTGGRTEVIVSPRDLDPATASIADELSRQYFLGYSSSAPKDGRWHTIEVRVPKRGNYTIRSRRGFIAS
jgi:Ca-activated chloride channel family protein